MAHNLDMDILRTFVLGVDIGSFAKAGERLGRSPSAISAQLRRLEDQVGQKLVEKAGRGLSPTAAGESLLRYARRILELNDEALATIKGADVEGVVRLGMPQDFAETWLPPVLALFSRSHPKIRFEVKVDRNAPLVDLVTRGLLDLALAWLEEPAGPCVQPVVDLPLAWVGQPDRRPWMSGAEPLALVAFDQPCLFRAAALDALETAGIPWRLTLTSPSLMGLWAAIEAGLGVTLRTPFAVPPALAILDTLPLPTKAVVSLALRYAEPDPPAAVRRLAAILCETIAESASR